MSAYSLNHATETNPAARVTGARLIGISDAVRGFLIHLTESWYRIGSAPCEDLTLADTAVADRQCLLARCDNGSYEIADLDSGRATRVNGERIHDAVLHNGDTLQIGHYEFSYLTDEKPVTGHIPGTVPEPAPDPALPVKRVVVKIQRQQAEPDAPQQPADTAPDVSWNVLIGLGAVGLFAGILLVWLLLG